MESCKRFLGTWLMGQTDRISALSAICMKHGIWLHVVGSNLAALAISGAIPESVSVIAKVADSFTLQPREWLGISMAPRVTLYKDTDPALVRVLCQLQIFLKCFHHVPLISMNFVLPALGLVVTTVYVDLLHKALLCKGIGMQFYMRFESFEKIASPFPRKPNFQAGEGHFF